MNGLLPLLKKELLQAHRTFRLWVLLAAFVFVGLASPLFAKLTPELLKLVGDDETAGISIVIDRAPTVVDALFQYQKNFALLPLLVLLLVAPLLAADRQSGWLALTLTKPVSRRAVLTSKMLAPVLQVTLFTLVAFGACAFYTHVLFGDARLDVMARMTLVLWLLVVVHIPLAMLASVVMRSVSAAMGVAFAGYAALGIWSVLPTVSNAAPSALLQVASSWAFGKSVDGSDVGLAVGVSIVFAVGLAELAVQIFHRQE